MVICELSNCTGCGMCVNICRQKAITMAEGEHGFIFPKINNEICIDCNLCKSRCPSNSQIPTGNNVQNVYAAWNRNNEIRGTSSSGGIFYLLSNFVIDKGGVVAGVAWNKRNHPQHILIDNVDDIGLLQGSKYSQSNTQNIYAEIKELLQSGRIVLFSGTPCQNIALKSYLGKEYCNLVNIDLVCHGVPSNRMLDDYYNMFNRKVDKVRLRYKDPWWDYCFVRLDFEDGSKYQALTIEDDYFNLFNIGFSLRESCHNCKYANTHRYGDITLADFWGFKAHNFKTRDYNKGTSCVLINSEKGKRLFDAIKDFSFYEESTLDEAINGNKCLKEPFKVDKIVLDQFWRDYESGMNIHKLNKKYCAGTFQLPKFMTLRRLVRKYRWLLK